jgi:uncharacterized membrane protein (DUF485 family)
MAMVVAIAVSLCIMGTVIAGVFELQAQRELDEYRQLVVCREAAKFDTKVTCPQ